MLIGLNGASTMQASLLKDLEIAEKLKYDYLEIWVAKLRAFLEENSLEQLAERFSASSVKPYALNSIERITFRSPEEEESLMSELRELCEAAQAIQCPYIVVVPSLDVPDVHPEQIHAETVHVLQKMGRVAQEYGIGLAFEFLGFRNCTVNTVGQSYAIVKDVAMDNVGMVVDTFHFYANDSRLEDLQQIDGRKIFIFHINDAEDVPKDQLTDAHRLYPGEGVIPLSEIVSALRKTGYNHMVSIEMFRPEYWEQDPLEVAAKAKEGAEKFCK